jgi:hypothetical protein
MTSTTLALLGERCWMLPRGLRWLVPARRVGPPEPPDAGLRPAGSMRDVAPDQGTHPVGDRDGHRAQEKLAQA